MEQDKEIDDLKENVKKLKERIVYELAEQDNTVKRYKKEVDQTKEFAISKFAKEILDVRDDLQRSLEYLSKIKLD